MTVIKINPGNKALEFIDSRISDEKYRGVPSSEHNRYDMIKIVSILELLNKYAPNQQLMSIRTTDVSKRPENESKEYVYAKFCNETKQKTGIGTQDAMRKNLFVDLHRMNFIIRYDKNKQQTDPFSKQQVKFVSISKQGLKLIKAKNLLDKYFIFSKGIDQLVGGYIDIILDILRDKEYKIDKISIYEYMFFISAINTKSSFNISTEYAVKLIKHYRNLTPIQRKSVIETLKVTLNPKNYDGNKNKKKDFHNWHNKTAQIFHLLNQTVYFEVRGEQLVLKSGKDSYETISAKLDRSLNEKYQYFINHNIDKKPGFELHHIVPISWSENIHHFKILDKWENMLYIDGFSHAKITQNKNRNIILQIKNKDLKLLDYSDNEVYLQYMKNVVYQYKQQPILKKYNKDLLSTIK